MTDEPTRRLAGALHGLAATGEHSEEPPPVEHGGTSGRFDRVSAQTSEFPEAFSDREGPTLASPNSDAVTAQASLEHRVSRALDRIQQLEADFESLDAKFLQLDAQLETERSRGRAARIGRYLLWGVIIAAMATLWMMLRLRSGTHY